MKKIIYENKLQKTDVNGKVISREDYSEARIEQEPTFIKLYIRDLCMLNDIPKSSDKILNELLFHLNYENEIILSAGLKKRIVKKLEIKAQTLNNALSTLTKKNILKRLDRGIYKLNPNLFGKGKWQDIRKLRIEWEYSGEGRKLVSVNVEENKIKSDTDNRGFIAKLLSRES